MVATREKIKEPKTAAAAVSPGKEKAAAARQYADKAQKAVQRKINEEEEKRVCHGEYRVCVGIGPTLAEATASSD